MRSCLLLWHWGLEALFISFGPELLHIYKEQADVIACGMEILSYTTMTYFLCGLMDLFPGALRGMGYSTVPMILSIIGTVGMRILWIYGLFPTHRSLGFLFISYPASWIANHCDAGDLLLVCEEKKDSQGKRTVIVVDRYYRNV